MFNSLLGNLACFFLSIGALSAVAERTDASDTLTNKETQSKASEVFGTAHPMFVQVISPDGHWLTACQTRKDTNDDGKIEILTGHHGEMRGDQPELFLFTQSNRQGESIHSLADYDSSGRFVALKRNSRLVLRDMRTDSEIDLSELGADAKEDGNAALPVRGADFNESGTHMLYLRDDQLVVRDLVTGTERVIDPGPGLLWRAEYLGAGQWIRVYMVPKDTNGNGQLDLPKQVTTLAGGRCRGQALSYGTYGYSGDEFVEIMVEVATGKARSLDVVGWNNHVIIVREANGALRWIDGRGDDRQTVPSECGARLISVSSEHGSVVVECAHSQPTRGLYLYDGGDRRDLHVEVSTHPQSRWRDARLKAISRTRLFDRDRQQLVPRSDARTLGLHENLILQEHEGGEIRLRDLNTDEETILAGPTEKWVGGRQFDSFVVVRHEEILLVDLNRGKVVGTLPSMPVFLDAPGRALVMSRDAQGARMGPLYWVSVNK
ncbi:MAG: hypothetical protein AB8G18_07255 [Gammaproteobacteria bacterium]